MNLSENEILYSPSQWSNRKDVINVHTEFAINETNKNRKEIPCLLDIPYGNKERQKFDLYGTDLPKNASIFIYIHGGYWQQLNKDMSGYVVAPFYKNKIKTIVIGYSLCPDISVNEIVEEIKIAVKKCIEYAKENGSKNIYISGYSAGSQLICSLFTNFYQFLSQEEQLLLKAVILCCGVYDLTPLIDTYVNNPLKLNYDEAKLLSPLYDDLKTLNFKVHVVVGEYDSPAFKKQSKLYFEKIQTVCNNTSFKIIHFVDHFSIVENFSCDDYELVKFVLEIENNTKYENNY